MSRIIEGQLYRVWYRVDNTPKQPVLVEASHLGGVDQAIHQLEPEGTIAIVTITEITPEMLDRF